MESDSSDASERYCVALACDSDVGFTVLHAHLAWTAYISNQLPDNADAGGDFTAGGTREGNAWVGLALDQDVKVAGLIRAGDRDIQVSGGCRCLYNYRNNM